jgi:hypothetical protein
MRHPDLVKTLRDARGSDCLVTYVTSTRPGIATIMAIDAVRHFVAHMPPERVKRLDLFLHTDGGDSTVPWRLMTYLREYAEEVHVLVPHRAFSAGTLTALGADRIVMHPLGMLGPIDPTVPDPYGRRDEETGQRPGVSVEDVAAYTAYIQDDLGLKDPQEMLEAFKILAEQVHPLTIGGVYRGTQQGRLLGRKLLGLRNDKPTDDQITAILAELTRKLYYHGHPINRGEAKDLGLPVDNPSSAVEEAMWDLYLAYEQDLEMDQVFEPVAEAARAGAQVPTQAGTSSRPVQPPPLRRVVIESEAQADVFASTLELTLSRTAEGLLAASIVAIEAGWSIER